jgi:hypothetical protein
MQGNRSNIVAGNVFHTPVIPSEEDRSLVNDLRSREPALSDRPAGGSRMGTCFSRFPQDAALRKAAGLSTLRSDSQASRHAPLEMTECGTLHSTTKPVSSPSGATPNV